MIRNMLPKDIQDVGQVWLTTSIIAHSFVPEEFWRSDLKIMTTEILPHPNTRGYVHEEAGVIDAFISLSGDNIGCLFVLPEKQGSGIGSALLDYVKQNHTKLYLNVYKKNESAVGFYQSQAFRLVGGSICPYTQCEEHNMLWERS